MKDKVSNVLAAAIAVAGAMCDCAPLMDARDAALMANELTPPLVEKVGEVVSLRRNTLLQSVTATRACSMKLCLSMAMQACKTHEWAAL